MVLLIFGSNQLDRLKFVMLFWYQPNTIIPNTITRNKFLSTICSNLSSKLPMKVSNSSFSCLGDLRRLTKCHVLLPILTSELIHSWRYEMSMTFRANEHTDTHLHVLYLKDDPPSKIITRIMQILFIWETSIDNSVDIFIFYVLCSSVYVSHCVYLNLTEVSNNSL